jgi:Tfp pilus assembly protein PilW
MMSRLSYLTTDTELYVQQEGRKALDIMAAELRVAGNVNDNASIVSPGAQRLDFQLDRGYDVAVCGGVCWGTDDPAFPTGWVHYVVDTVTTAPNGRLRRCTTANQLDPMPVNFVGCRVMANNVSPTLAMTTFLYDHPTRTVTATLQVTVTSRQVAGGTLTTGALPLRVQIRLRNP